MTELNPNQHPIRWAAQKLQEIIPVVTSLKSEIARLQGEINELKATKADRKGRKPQDTPQ